MSFTTERLVKIELEQIPVIEQENISAFLSYLDEIQDKITVRSYGARIIRNASPELFDRCYNWLEKRNFGVETMDFLFGKRLHTDAGGVNAVTLHHTKYGEADTYIVVGEISSRFVDDHAFSKMCNDQLVREGILDTLEMLDNPPFIALTGTLRANDLLIFDHTQPHTMVNKVEPRKSIAYYS